MNYVELGTLLTPGGAVNFAYAEKQVKPWRCTYRGAGRYFTDPRILAGYVCGRGWVRPDQCDSLAEALQIMAFGIVVF